MLKTKNQMITTNVEKVFEKIKNFQITTNGGNFLHLLKDISKKPTANIFNGERLNMTEKEARCPLSPLLCKILPEALAGEMKAKNRNQRHRSRKDAIKLFIFVDDIVIYRENPK